MQQSFYPCSWLKFFEQRCMRTKDLFFSNFINQSVIPFYKFTNKLIVKLGYNFT